MWVAALAAEALEIFVFAHYGFFEMAMFTTTVFVDTAFGIGIEESKTNATVSFFAMGAVIVAPVHRVCRGTTCYFTVVHMAIITCSVGPRVFATSWFEEPAILTIAILVFAIFCAAISEIVAG